MRGIEIREATRDDVPGILDTLRLSLGETPLLRRTGELWDWKHRVNPFGESVVLVAVAEGTIAGVRAMMRWDLLSASGELVRCVRPVDTSTHPSFTRRGIFKNLTMSAIEVVRSRGVRLIFNTPNEMSAPGYLGMGWRHVGWIGALVRPRFGGALTNQQDELPSIDLLAPHLDPMGAMPRDLPVRPPIGLRTPRRTEYLDWRFTSHPTASYGWAPSRRRSGGVVCRASWRAGRSELVISDMFGEPDHRTIGEIAAKGRSRYLAGWFQPGSPERRAAVRGGMIPVPRLRTLRMVALALDSIDRDPYDLRSWDLTTSDLELL